MSCGPWFPAIAGFAFAVRRAGRGMSAADHLCPAAGRNACLARSRHSQAGPPADRMGRPGTSAWCRRWGRLRPR